MAFIINLFLCFVFLGVLLSGLFLLKNKGDRSANRILSIYTFLFSFELLNNALRWSGEINNAAFVHLNLAHFPLWAIYGPLLSMYTRRVIKVKGLQWTDIFFLFPTVAITATVFPFYGKDTVEKLEIVNNGSAFDHIPWPSYGIWLVILLMFFYAFLLTSVFRGTKVSVSGKIIGLSGLSAPISDSLFSLHSISF